MRNLNAAKGPPIRLFFVLFVRQCGCANMANIIKHEMAFYISYVKHQLFKDAAVYIQQYFCRLAVSTAGATLA